jgi:F420-non-reducing hydrogenase iron-sulfur subunit
MPSLDDMSTANLKKKILLITCNWHAYHSLEAAGVDKKEYTASVFPVRLPCLGRVTPGIILKAFEKGADGVYLLGCPEGNCHYQTGSGEVEKVYLETLQIIKLLGFDEDQLGLDFIQAGESDRIVRCIQEFLEGIREAETVI